MKLKNSRSISLGFRLAINLKSFSPCFLGHPVDMQLNFGSAKNRQYMISEYHLKNSNETILIYAMVLFCGRNFRAGVFVVFRFVFATFCWSNLKSRRRKGSKKSRTLRFMERAWF